MVETEFKYLLNDEDGTSLKQIADRVCSIRQDYLFKSDTEEVRIRRVAEDGKEPSYYKSTKHLQINPSSALTRIEENEPLTEKEFYDLTTNALFPLFKLRYIFTQDIGEGIKVTLDEIVRVKDFKRMGEEALHLLEIEIDMEQFDEDESFLIIPQWLEDVIANSQDVTQDSHYTNYEIAYRLSRGDDLIITEDSTSP